MDRDALADMRPHFQGACDRLRQLVALLQAMEDMQSQCGRMPPPDTPQDQRWHFLFELRGVAADLAEEANDHALRCEEFFCNLWARAGKMPGVMA